MDQSAPLLYPKNRDQVIESLEEDLRQTLAGWNGPEKGPGRAMIRLFSRLSDLSVQRLNQVPDKHFLAFLNSAGVDFVPPAAAVTELAFTLADDGPDTVTVVRGTQMATAGTETEEEVVFETERDVTLTKARLVKVLALDGRSASDRTGEALGDEPASWPAFEGSVERERVFFLGDDHLFRFDDETQRAGATVTLTVNLETPGQPEKERWAIVWSYFDGTSWTPLPKDSVVDGTHHFSQNGQVTLKHLPQLVEHETGAALALVLSGGEGRKHLPVIRSIQGSRSISLASVPAQSAELVSAMQSGTAFVPLDRSGEFFPLGQKPARLDALYIRDDQVFARTGGTCVLSMTVAHAPDQVTTTDAAIVWEYAGPSGWTPIPGATDTTGHFRKAAAVSYSFTVQPMKRTKVNGVEGLWIRARLHSGSYEKPGSVTRDGDSVRWNPPVLAAPMISRFTMTLSFTEAAGKPMALSRAMSRVDGMIRDFSREMGQLKGFSPFSANDEGPSLYLGFDRPFSPETWVQIRVDVDEDAMEEEYGTPVIFEYHTGEITKPLGVSDGTLGLKTRGFLGFFAPPDHGAAEISGTRAFWFRLRPETPGRPGPYLKTMATNTVPAVNAETFSDVILGSSDGKAGQTFRLPRPRVLPGTVLAVLEPDRPSEADLDILGTELSQSDGPGPVFPCESDRWVRWVEVPDFYASGPSSRHFALDPVNGTVRFGDGERGAIPPVGQNNIRLVTVRSHDGARGNVKAHAVTVVRNPVGGLAAIKRVTNVEAAAGGSDLETLDDIRQRGPQRLKHRDRAVTLEDFAWLAREASREVKNARCFPVTDALGLTKAGHVTVVITPESRDRKPVPGPALIRKVRSFLESHALANLMADRNIHVKGPSFVECSVNITVTPLYPEQSDQVELAILKRLDDFLHPLSGGPERKGWDLGRDLYLSEISAEIEQVDGVDHVGAVTLSGSIQQCRLNFAKEKGRHRPAPFDLVPGIRVATFDEEVRFLLADPAEAGSLLQTLTVTGFKAGDRVSLVSSTQEEILDAIDISRVEALAGNTPAWNIDFGVPFERPADWDRVAGLMSADKQLRMRVTGEARLDASGNIAGVTVRGFDTADRICLVQASIRSPDLSFIPVSAVEFATDRVSVPLDCLVYSGTHDVTMTIGD